MNKLILVRYGEISLKGLNRNYFIKTLMKNIRWAISRYDNIEVRQIQGRILIEKYDIQQEDEIIEKLRKVFGIVYLTKAYEVDSDIETIKDTALFVMKDKTNVTFKVEARRADKTFPYKSPEIARMVGAHILINTDTVKVDVHNPDILLTVEIRKNADIY